MATYPTLISLSETAVLERASVQGPFAAEESHILTCFIFFELLRRTVKPDNRRMGTRVVDGVGDAHNFGQWTSFAVKGSRDGREQQPYSPFLFSCLRDRHFLNLHLLCTSVRSCVGSIHGMKAARGLR